MTTIHLPYGTSPALEKQLDVQILDLRVNVGQGFNHAILDKRDCICVIRALYVTGRGASATFCKTSLKDLLRFRLLLSHQRVAGALECTPKVVTPSRCNLSLGNIGTVSETGIKGAWSPNW